MVVELFREHARVGGWIQVEVCDPCARALRGLIKRVLGATRVVVVYVCSCV